MARRRKDSRGWTLRQESPAHTIYVRFRPAPGSRTIERSTGTRDPIEADVEAAKIVARERAGGLIRRKKVRVGVGQLLSDFTGGWTAWLAATHAATTIATWEGYAISHFETFFGTVSAITDEGCAAYQRARLLKVEGVTVRKEQTALRSLIAYLEEVGAIAPGVVVPRLPKRATGTSHPVRRRRAAPPLSPTETLAVIRRLPEWSSSRKVRRFAIRARFLVGYDTGLRPSTLDRLQCPRHYRIGSKVLRLDKASVKERWARDVPLSRRARRILDHVLRGLGPDYSGPIFGWHNYREHIDAAARAALPPETAERFCAAHLRSAMLTHELEAGADIPGMQWRVGHTLMSTTARYIKPSYRAAEAAVQRRRGGPPQSAGPGPAGPTRLTPRDH